MSGTRLYRLGFHCTCGCTEVAASRDNESGEECGLRSVALFRCRLFSTAVPWKRPSGPSIRRQSGISDRFQHGGRPGGTDGFHSTAAERHASCNGPFIAWKLEREPTAYSLLLLMAGAVLADPAPMLSRLARDCIALTFTAPVPALHAATALLT